MRRHTSIPPTFSDRVRRLVAVVTEHVEPGGIRNEADPDRERVKSRAYYAANRERVLARVKAQKRRRKAQP